MQTLFSKTALTALAAFLLAANPANADDPAPPKTQPAAKKQTASTTDSKDAKSISDAAKKFDLSTPYSDPNIHGSVTVGYESTFGKNCHQSGMFSEFELSKDFHLSNGGTVSIFVSVGRYPNSSFFH